MRYASAPAGAKPGAAKKAASSKKAPAAAAQKASSAAERTPATKPAPITAAKRPAATKSPAAKTAAAKSGAAKAPATRPATKAAPTPRGTTAAPGRKQAAAAPVATPAPVPRRAPTVTAAPARATAGPSTDRRIPRPGAATPRRLAPPGQIPRHIAPPQISELDGTYVRGLRRAIIFLLVLGLAGFLLDGSNRPANPSLVPARDPGAVKGLPAFGSATLTVTSSRHKDACVLEAVTQAQQQAGLMGRKTVGPYSGMAFVFSQLSTEQFWMKGTLIPLSIAWFDAGGRYESAATMPPCPPKTKVCPLYKSSGPYEIAIEVPAGQLKNMGIGPGTTISLGGACTT